MPRTEFYCFRLNLNISKLVYFESVMLAASRAESRAASHALKRLSNREVLQPCETQSPLNRNLFLSNSTTSSQKRQETSHWCSTRWQCIILVQNCMIDIRVVREIPCPNVNISRIIVVRMDAVYCGVHTQCAVDMPRMQGFPV